MFRAQRSRHLAPRLVGAVDRTGAHAVACRDCRKGVHPDVDDGGPVTLTRHDVNQLLTEHGLRPSRALGQNFVADPNTVRRIARLASVGPGDRVGTLPFARAEP